jgi:hypothetical protein
LLPDEEEEIESYLKKMLDLEEDEDDIEFEDDLEPDDLIIKWFRG